MPKIGTPVDDLMSLREVAQTSLETIPATFYEEDDIIMFLGTDDNYYFLYKTKEKEWIKVKNLF